MNQDREYYASFGEALKACIDGEKIDCADSIAMSPLSYLAWDGGKFNWHATDGSVTKQLTFGVPQWEAQKWYKWTPPKKIVGREEAMRIYLTDDWKAIYGGSSGILNKKTRDEGLHGKWSCTLVGFFLNNAKFEIVT